MKRKLIMGIMMLGVLCFAACGKESSSDSAVQAEVQDVKEEVKEEKKSNKKGEISMEALRNHEESPVSDFRFRESDTMQIEKYLGNDEVVVIPEEYNGKKITGCFVDNEELEYVISGSGLKEIGQLTFSGCSSLKNVELQEGLEIIDACAFQHISSLSELYIPSSVVEFNPTNLVNCNDSLIVKVKAGSVPEQVMKDTIAPFSDVVYEVYE